MSMPLPNLGLIGEFTICDKDIIAGLNANFQLLDNLVQLSFDGIVATLPPGPLEGDKYILSTDKTINLFNGTEWISYPAQEGYLGYNKDDGFLYFYNGTDWIVFPAELVGFDNSGTSITSTNLQDAIIELLAIIESAAVTGLANVGSGAGVFRDLVSGTANFRSITGDPLISITELSNEINISLEVGNADGDVLVLKRTPLIEPFETTTAPSSSNWDIVGDGGSNLVAVSSGSTATLRSTDNGETWITGGTLPAAAYRRVTYGNGVYVTIANSGTNRIHRSVDGGVTWVPATSNNNTLSYMSVIYVGAKFIANVDASGFIIQSSDGGDTWVTVVSLVTNSSSELLKISNNRFIHVSISGTHTVFNSSITAQSTFTGPTTYYSSAFGNGTIIIGTTSQLYVSYNQAKSFTKIPVASTTPLTVYNKIAFGNGLFFILSQSNPTFRSAYSNDNGNTWNTYPLDLTNSWNYIRFQNDRFIVAPFSSATLGYIDAVFSKELGMVDKRNISESYSATMSVSNISPGGTSTPPDYAGTSSTDPIVRVLNEIKGKNKSDFISLNPSTGVFTIKKTGYYKALATSFAIRIGNTGLQIRSNTTGDSTLFMNRVFATDSSSFTNMNRSEVTLHGIAFLEAGQEYVLRQLKDTTYSGSNGLGDVNVASGVRVVWCSLSLEFLE